jgi:hypothetical protein
MNAFTRRCIVEKVVVVRYTAVLLVLVFSAASARMLVCDSSCANATPTFAPETCHDHTDGEAALAQLTNAHSCDHSDVVLTLTTSKVTFLQRFASSVAVLSYRSNTTTHRSNEHSAHSPPGTAHHLRLRAITNLRI